ncbi:hypothetical protein CspHIS471_0403690 [Cutaneotrichosporon sp. HIS471]|nr:hypothetical protein CspHIS471_0403690 [Cutaneotrichosporon sp. HIS471]
MAPALSRELLAVLTSPQTTLNQAADAIEEHIMYRRAKGDTLLGVASSLHSMESRSPRLAPAIRQAQYATNVPPSADLNAPVGSGSLASASTTPQAVLNYLLSSPEPSLLTARKVILEYVLNRETRLREKKHGTGGKGTLGRDSFEEIGARLGEIEDGLRGTGVLVGAHTAAVPAVPDEELDDPRKMGLALILSLRMLLSYFTLPDLARQLLLQHPTDAERTLVQHIRRRVPGEGRYNVGRELEFVESLTLNRRPALRPAFRSARARTYLAGRALYPISLPAPSKSACIKLLAAFIRDVDEAGPNAAQSYMQAPPLSHTFSVTGGSPKETSSSAGYRMRKAATGSPISTHSSSPGSPSRASHLALPHDPSPVESYALELISEFVTREKRDYMLKNKWVKTGREHLGKDIADMESILCVVGKSYPGPHAPSLMPVFLQVRRTFALPPTSLAQKIVEPFYDMLQSPPDPDSVPLREPSVSSTTASLYVNPRLPDAEALDLIEELLENEREKGINADVTQEKTIAWLEGLIGQMVKRFPDGSYETVFDQARYLAAHPRVWPDAANSSANPEHPLMAGSSGDTPNMPRFSQETMSSVGGHKRSASMPMGSGSVTDEGSRQSARLSSVGSETSYNHWAPIEAQRSVASPPMSPSQDVTEESLHKGAYEGVTNGTDMKGLGLSGFAASSSATRANAPPMLNLYVPGPELDIGSALDTPSPRQPMSGGGMSSKSGSSGNGGWWDVISPTSGSPGAPKVWERPKSPPGRSSLSPTSPGHDLSVSAASSLAPPPQAAAEEMTSTSTPPKPPLPGDSPMTPQMEARIAMLMNPEVDVDATPKAPAEMPRMQRPELSTAAMEALARLEGVQLHDESLAKLEGAHKTMPSVGSIAIPESKVGGQSDERAEPKANASSLSKSFKESPPPAPKPRPPTPEDDLYARLDFVPMDYNPMHSKPVSRQAGPVWPNKMTEADRLARSNTKRSPANAKPNGGTPVWPRRKPSDSHAQALQTVGESGDSSGPASAPIRGSDAPWHSEEPGSLARSATQGKRPSPSPGSSRSALPSASGTTRRSQEAQRDSGDGAKSKFGAFLNRSMTRREKENTVSSTTLSHQQSRRGKPPVANKPGQWNRDMVAGIMGPPAERRQV